VRGFTLVELMVTVAVAAVVLALAVPSFQTTLRNHRLTTYANEFIAALNLARTEAIRRGQRVVLCKSANGSSCQTGGNNWEIGWIAFVDLDRNGNNENTRQATEPILRVWPALPAGFTLRPNNNFGNYLRYGPDGSANNIGTFALCYHNNRVDAKAIVITRLRPRLGQDTNGNRIPENDSGDITSCFTS
jgi:type IV fimbrial biogenesis protein FimT